MKNKDEKKKRSKIVLVAVIGFIGVAFVVTLVTAKSQPTGNSTPKQYILGNSSALPQDNSSMSSESSASSKKTQNDTQLVTQFVQDYLSQKLDTKQLTERAGRLKTECSTSLFQSLAIDSTTKQLQTMLNEYQKDKQVNTNSSVRLVNRAIQNLTLYQEVGQASSYFARVTYTETAPDHLGAFSFEEQLTLSINNGQIVALQTSALTPAATKGGF